MSKTASKQNASRQSTSPQGSRGRSTPGRSTKATSGHPGSVARWTFLSNHAHVLAVLHSNPELVLRQVAVEVGITERAVQRIIQDLEEGGFIRREKVGRKNRYFILTNEPLRHPIEAHRIIGDLLKLINK
jgi:predicted transcriptional regulator